MSLERFRDELLAKKPVIHTRFAEQFLSAPEDVEQAYNHHFHTHVPLGDTSSYANRLIERVSGSRTAKGAVVAPWGYGKTSTLIFTWRACQDAGIVAVPPFICSSLRDILDATYGWLCFQLGSGWRTELTAAYEQFGKAAFEERVKAYASQAGVAQADAREVLQRALDDGSFSPELATSSLMKFLECAASIVRSAGFSGLVVLADELQELVGKSADVRGTIQRLREVVLWLAAHPDLPLGLVLCMPDTTEGLIQEDGQDILDRLKTDRLYISLRNIYSPDFARQLWERYVDLFGVQNEAARVLDGHLLTALGQIATRQDLGRGPRTVVDVFQCAIRHFEKTGQTYTPVALIDDFLTGQISFDMQANPIRFAVEEALGLLSRHAATEAHRRAIKLWAAFPEHGCPDEVLETYGAKEAAYELSEQHGIHGPLITYQSVGYTLRKLATFSPGGTAVERIARDFWLVYKEQDPRWAEAAQSAFVAQLLPRVFEKRRGAWGNWELSLTPSGSCGGQLTGTFTEQYPSRVLDVQVAVDPSRIQHRRADARSDFQFDFVLLPSTGSASLADPGHIEYVEGNQRWVRFTLNLGSRALAGASLPQDLRNLKSSIHPNFLTPQLMLAFVDYVGRWEGLKPENRMLESERGPVNAIMESMLNYSVRVLFNDGLSATFGPKLNSSGLQIIRDVFALMCRTAWPPESYHPLLAISDRALGDYIDALGKLSLREKRGDVPLGERRKGRLASLFGVESHKTFENRAKTDYVDLMRYKDLGGDQAEVRLQPHPLEREVLRRMDASGRRRRVSGRDVPELEGEALLALGGSLGYRDCEVAMVLRLLIARELVGKDDEAGVVYRLPAGPSAHEVSQQLGTLLQKVRSLPAEVISEAEGRLLMDRVGELNNRFAPELEEEALEELANDIRRAEADVAALVGRKRQAVLEELCRSCDGIEQHVASLDQMCEFDSDIPAGLDFRRHLVDLQVVLRQSRRKLKADLVAADNQLRALHGRAAAIDASSLAAFYADCSRVKAELSGLTARVQALVRQRQGFLEWLKLLKESDLLYTSLATMPDLRSRLTDGVVRDIMRNFTQKGVRALTEDAEVFRNQFDDIARERDARVAAGNEEFGSTKQRYRQWLASMGVERPEVPARYSPVEHEQSYQDLYSQTRVVAVSHVEGLRARAGQLDLDLRKARRIHLQKMTDSERDALAGLEQKRTRVVAELDAVSSWLGKVDLAQATDLDEYASRIAAVRSALAELDEQIRRLILRPVPPATASEQRLATILADRREVDLTELVLRVGDDMDLDELMAALRGLYQGNQVTIKIQKRG